MTMPTMAPAQEQTGSSPKAAALQLRYAHVAKSVEPPPLTAVQGPLEAELLGAVQLPLLPPLLLPPPVQVHVPADTALAASHAAFGTVVPATVHV